MNKLTFCPFINGVCRSDCVFHVPHNIALNNGNSAQCELAAFICCSDEDSIQSTFETIKALHEKMQ